MRWLLRGLNAALWLWSVYHFLDYLRAVDRQSRLRMALAHQMPPSEWQQELDDFYEWQAHLLAKRQDR